MSSDVYSYLAATTAAELIIGCIDRVGPVAPCSRPFSRGTDTVSCRRVAAKRRRIRYLMGADWDVYERSPMTERLIVTSRTANNWVGAPRNGGPDAMMTSPRDMRCRVAAAKETAACLSVSDKPCCDIQMADSCHAKCVSHVT